LAEFEQAGLPEGKLPASSFLKLLDEGKQVSLYVTATSNPAYDDPETERTVESLKDEKRIPLHIAFDTHMTETAALADIVLPAATFLESWEVISEPGMDLLPYVTLRQPVVQPMAETRFLRAGEKMSSPPFRSLGESRSPGDVFLEVAHRMGGDTADSMQFSSTRDYVQAVVASIGGLKDAGGLKHLQRHGFWVDSSITPDEMMYRDHGFPTPSGLFEIHSDTLMHMNISPLPVFRADRSHMNLKEQEFILVTPSINLQTGRTANCKWLSEIAHDNPVWINTAVAEIFGIREGDRVRIASSRGEIQATAHLTQGIHPGTISLAAGFGHWAWGRVAEAKRGESDDPDTKLVWWGKTGNGVHPNPLVPVYHDPDGGGQTWHSTRVSIEKL
jgi:anaerobic selenocysteine-containing dehydrogenase